MASRKKKRKKRKLGVSHTFPRGAGVPSPHPAYPPNSLGMKLWLVMVTTGFAAGTVLGIRELIGALITGEICSGRDCYAWNDEPGGYTMEMMYTAFLTLCAGLAVMGGWNGLRYGLARSVDRYGQVAEGRNRFHQ